MKLTVSFVKGNKHESSVYHNNRSIENNFDYNKKGHKHIRKEETKNNKVLIHRDIEHVYDLLFYKTIQNYNAKNKKKHAERCFDGQTEVEKQASIAMYQQLHAFLKQNKAEQKQSLERLRKDDDDEIADFFEKNKSMKLSDARRKLTEAKHAKTFGQVMHDKMKHDKTTIPQVEFIMQVGNAADFNLTDNKGFFLGKDGKRIKNDEGKEININSSADDIEKITPKMVRKNKKLWEQANTILEKSLKDFQKRNKHFVVYNAVIHNDEATPHMHFNAIPLATGYKRGLENRVSINKALSNEGYEYSTKDNRKQFTDFQHAQADAIAKIMESETGITRKAGVTNNIKNIHEYKKVQNAVASEKENLENLQKEVANNREQITMQNATFSSNQKTLDAQEAQINTNRSVLSKYNTSISNAQKRLKTNENTLKTQNALIQQNKPKLDVLNNYDTLLTTAQNKLKNTKIAQKQAEDAKITAEQQKEDAEKTRDKARKEAETANADYLAQLNAREQALNERENALNTKDSNLTARKNELNKSIINFNNRVYGWTDQNGKKHIGLNEFSRNLKKREDDLNKRENSFKKLVTSFADNFKRNYIEYGINQNFKFMQKYCYKNNAFDQTLYNNVVKNFMHNKKLHEPIDNAVFNGKVEKHSYPRFKAFVHAIKATMSGHNELDDIVKLADNVDNALSPQVKELPNMKPIDLYKDEDDDLNF